jgi:hypothetical protein
MIAGELAPAVKRLGRWKCKAQGSPNGHGLRRFASARAVVIGRQTDADAGVLFRLA